jgi:hypothetical protein
MLHEVLARVLRPLDSPLAFVSAADFWADHLQATDRFEQPIDRAIVGATRVDCVGFAFAAAYQAALHRLVPSLDWSAMASFAATENRGAHPRQIETTLEREGDGWRLLGTKTWVTLLAPPNEGAPAGNVIVIARVPRVGHEDRPTLRAVRVNAAQPGVTITSLGSLPFVPEIPHASMQLDNVFITGEEDVLPGDGYERYLKAFRTIEDVHVHAAVISWLHAVGTRARWPRELREKMLSTVISFRALAEVDPLAAETHIALGGAIREGRAIIDACEPHWAEVDEATGMRWKRDRPLFDIASKARGQRLASAWTRVEGEPV